MKYKKRLEKLAQRQKWYDENVGGDGHTKSPHKAQHAYKRPGSVNK